MKPKDEIIHGTFSNATASMAFTVEDMEACIATMEKICREPIPVDVIANPQAMAVLRRILSPATGRIGLASMAAGMMPLYQTVDMPITAMAISMSDGTLQVIAISGGKLTADETARALRAALAVKDELRLPIRQRSQYHPRHG